MRKSRMTALALVLLFFTASAQTPADSLPIDGVRYALHKVKKGETLYGVSRKYNVQMAEVVLVNKIGGNGYTISEGQSLVIPLYAKKIDTGKEAKAAAEGYITHVVKQGETLYSISRNYNGVTPQMLREKNKLKSDTLKINQQLVVPQEMGILPPGNSATRESHTGAERRALADSERKYRASESAAATVEVTRGIAKWLDNDSEENQKNHYALHKYASIGSLVKVRNLMNNRTAFVKVIGKLPDIEENKNIAVTLSAATARELRVFDAKFLVELTIPMQKEAGESRK